MRQNVNWYDLGLIPYKKAWELQERIQSSIVNEKLAERDNELEHNRREDVILIVEHPHVYTIGKSGDEAHLLRGHKELDNLGATYIKTDRGGDITYHGPGQIVGYPILDLDRYFTDIHKYMRYLEEIIIRTCADFDIKAGRIDGLTGVWIDGAKICALGVRCSRWVTMHGFALNVNTNLAYFNHIIPCGLKNKPVTSMQNILNKPLDMGAVKKRILVHFGNLFDANVSIRKHLPELIRPADSLTPS